MRHSVGYGYAVKKNATAATPTKFEGGLTDFQRRRRHKNSTRRIDEIRWRRGLPIGYSQIFSVPANQPTAITRIDRQCLS
jgi:hypothetical protein